MPSFRQVLEAIAKAWTDEREKIRGGAEQLKAALRQTSEAQEHANLERELLARAKDYLGRAFDRRNGGFGGAPKFPQPMALDFLLRSAAGMSGEGATESPLGASTEADAVVRSVPWDGDEAREGLVGDTESLRIVTRTLDKMARGGIYDQLGGGFHRYSVDEVWLVPHFEKMLYDQAQLALVYLHAWQLTGRELYRRVVTETLDYVLREMTHRTSRETARDDSAGDERTEELIAFYSTQDADSLNAAGEMEEGAYYTWTAEEIREALGASASETPSAADDLSPAGAASPVDAPSPTGAHTPFGPFDAEAVNLFLEAYGVTERGNFEGKTILSSVLDTDVLAERFGPAEDEVERRLAAMRRQLLVARERRPAPGRDEKVLTAWNGLMLAAFAEAARVLGRDDYRVAAEASAAFLLENLRDERGRLLRTWKASPGATETTGGTNGRPSSDSAEQHGVAKLNGYLDDYADLAQGLLQLYQTTFDERWFVAARELADQILEHFADGAGHFYATSDDHEELLRRPMSQEDNALPSGGAMATLVLVQLAAYTGEDTYAQPAELALQLVAENAATMPLAFAQWLVALDLYLAPPVEVAIVGEQPAGDRDRSFLDVVSAALRPHVVVAASADPEQTTVPLLMGRRPVDGRPAAFVCRHFACASPITDPVDLARTLAER